MMVRKLNIIDENNINLFNCKDDYDYIIPIYQRAFTWGSEEIEQLIDDIADFEGENYYLGSLIVSKREDGKFEVVDGQQRLTALYILLSLLGQELNDDALSFECREKSTNTLKHLNNNQYTNSDNIELEQSIINGKEIFKVKLKTDEFRKSLKAKSVQTALQSRSDDGVQISIRNYLVEQLKKVSLFRIELPANTDLNRYFEIMNTRGEQLEATDILKARLMEKLGEETEQSAFAKIWDACRDMTGYLQLHFLPADRKILFGENWNELYLDKWTELQSTQDKSSSKIRLNDIISNTDTEKTSQTDTANYKTEKGEEHASRFHSIISFPYFLLHTLRVLYPKLDESEMNLVNASNEMIDDKKLLDDFPSPAKITRDFSKKFICCLLKTRFLFDQYIIKRENEDNKDGKWSLKKLQKSNNKDEYTESFEKNQDIPSNFEKILQLQSCLRVTDTSPKSMHWITELLIWMDKNTNNGILSDGKEYLKEIELFVKKRVNEIIKDENVWNKGTGTPRLLFNYLDYLLLEKYFKSTEKERSNYKDYTFKFANSVEHWYPQNPSEDGIALWDKDNGEGLSVNNFGNLCLVTTKVNSEFSNRSPESKSKEFEGKIADCSLKLREMSKKTKESDGKWGFPLGNEESPCKKHMDEMIQLIDESLKGIKEMNWTVAAIASVVAEPQ